VVTFSEDFPPNRLNSLRPGTLRTLSGRRPTPMERSGRCLKDEVTLLAKPSPTLHLVGSIETYGPSKNVDRVHVDDNRMSKDGVHWGLDGWPQLVLERTVRRKFCAFLGRLFDFNQFQRHEYLLLDCMSQPFAGRFDP
jgi:hypothetical protein